ncbi:hypothetical protein C8F01DRAFT_1253191 [Mycena amicta]|nr:hypothetical protein C8F01DRAFT_1253191 [Mycena amicta]
MKDVGSTEGHVTDLVSSDDKAQRQPKGADEHIYIPTGHLALPATQTRRKAATSPQDDDHPSHITSAWRNLDRDVVPATNVITEEKISRTTLPRADHEARSNSGTPKARYTVWGAFGVSLIVSLFVFCMLFVRRARTCALAANGTPSCGRTTIYAHTELVTSTVITHAFTLPRKPTQSGWSPPFPSTESASLGTRTLHPAYCRLERGENGRRPRIQKLEQGQAFGTTTSPLVLIFVTLAVTLVAVPERLPSGRSSTSAFSFSDTSRLPMSCRLYRGFLSERPDSRLGSAVPAQLPSTSASGLKQAKHRSHKNHGRHSLLDELSPRRLPHLPLWTRFAQWGKCQWEPALRFRLRSSPSHTSTHSFLVAIVALAVRPRCPLLAAIVAASPFALADLQLASSQVVTTTFESGSSPTGCGSA